MAKFKTGDTILDTKTNIKYKVIGTVKFGTEIQLYYLDVEEPKRNKKVLYAKSLPISMEKDFELVKGVRNE